MSNTQIPAMWPDVEAWFIGFVTAAKIVTAQPSLTGVDVKNEKPATAPANYRQVIVAADYGQNITPITRYVRVRMQAWSVLNGASDFPGAFLLANTAAYIAQTAPRDANPIVSVEVDAGPSRVIDTLSGIEYQAVTLLLEVAKL